MEILRPDDAAATLELVEEPLAAAGAEGELALGLLDRLSIEPDAWGDDVTLLVEMQDDRPAALVMMTGPHPALIVGFTEPDAVNYSGLVAAMLAGDRLPSGVNGARRWSDPFARAWAAVGEATPEVYRDLYAYELRSVQPPRWPAGEFRKAAAADTALLEGWVVAFGEDISEPQSPEVAARTVGRLAPVGDVTVWEHRGRAVSMAAITRRTPWSSCVALVYTPPELRGNGYASAVVARLSQRELDAGQRWCSLFTDAANPTSNHIYADIGYEAKSEFRHFVLRF
jgi:predicted GNAT family acetyltransferase